MSERDDMSLVIDVGNTTIAFAVVLNYKVRWVNRIDSQLKNKALHLQITGLLRELRRKFGDVKGAIICSVVPQLTPIICSAVKRELGGVVEIVGETLKVPIVNRYRNPRQVGQDRLVGAFAAFKLYGNPVIVIDLGTAITFDAVSNKGEYLGGVIVPGIRLSAEALFLKTAMLPEIDIQAPRSVIGKTTQESILSGIFYGYGCLAQGMIELISKQLGGQPRVIMTGGHTQLMKYFIKGVNGVGAKRTVAFKDLTDQNFKLVVGKNIGVRFIIDEHLVYKGLDYLLACR